MRLLILAMAPLLLAVPANTTELLRIVAPNGHEWLLLLLVGVIGTVAHLLMTWSLRFAPSATVAPMQYLEIPVATVVGLLLFGELPDGMAAFGIGLTVAAGVFVILREQATARRVLRNAPPTA